MRRTLPTLALGLWLALLALPAWSAGSSRIEEPAGEPESPEQQANDLYNQGLAERDDAWRLEKKLAAAAPDERPKLEHKVRRAYESSAKAFSQALALNPRHHQALSSLGYTQRQLGDYEKALATYNAALELKPDYGPAIEYRGEAYLGLNRIVDAQNSYRMLAEKEPALAAELLGAMKSWIEARKANPSGVDPAQIDAFATWVADRGEAAATSSLHKTRSW